MKKTHIIIGISIFVLALLIVTKGFGLFGGAATNAAGSATGTSVTSKGTLVLADSSGKIKISASEISSSAKWYSYDSNGVKVRFFIVKADDGTIRTAFDGCDVCYKNNKGYHQEGNEMVCNNCGRRYPISSVGTENKNPGGCWPGYLPNEIKDGQVIISKADLDNDVWRFL